jgi:hypothetical protein
MTAVDSTMNVTRYRETNDTCSMAPNGYFYKLALSGDMKSIFFAKFFCHDNGCRKCELDIANVQLGQCMFVSASIPVSFTVSPLPAGSEQPCLGEGTVVQSNNVLLLNYSSGACAFPAANLTVLNLGPSSGDCTAQADHFYRRVQAFSDGTIEVALRCIETTCATCEETFAVFPGEGCDPHAIGHFGATLGDAFSHCGTVGPSKKNATNGGLVAGGVIAGLFVLVVAFFLYVRHQQRHGSGKGYEPLQ